MAFMIPQIIHLYDKSNLEIDGKELNKHLTQNFVADKNRKRNHQQILEKGKQRAAKPTRSCHKKTDERARSRFVLNTVEIESFLLCCLLCKYFRRKNSRSFEKSLHVLLFAKLWKLLVPIFSRNNRMRPVLYIIITIIALLFVHIKHARRKFVIQRQTSCLHIHMCGDCYHHLIM